MARVTVNVCGLDEPLMLLTWICSPAIKMSKLTDPVIHRSLPAAVATESVVAPAVADDAKDEPPLSTVMAPATSARRTSYGSSGAHANSMVWVNGPIVSV